MYVDGMYYNSQLSSRYRNENKHRKTNNKDLMDDSSAFSSVFTALFKFPSCQWRQLVAYLSSERNRYRGASVCIGGHAHTEHKCSTKFS